jgi:hypothetical protein
MGHTSIALLYYINYWVIQIASSLLSFTMKDQTSTTSSWLDCLYWSPTNQYSVNGPQVFLYSPSFIPGNLSWIFCQSTGTDEAETQGWWCRHASSFSLYFTPFLFPVLEILQYWLEWLKIYRTVAWSSVKWVQRGMDRTRVQEHKFKLKMLRNENQPPGVLWAPAI